METENGEETSNQQCKAQHKYDEENVDVEMRKNGEEMGLLYCYNAGIMMMVKEGEVNGKITSYQPKKNFWTFAMLTTTLD